MNIDVRNVHLHSYMQTFIHKTKNGSETIYSDFECVHVHIYAYTHTNIKKIKCANVLSFYFIGGDKHTTNT